jgi:hypothetical protein
MVGLDSASGDQRIGPFLQRCRSQKLEFSQFVTALHNLKDG